MGAYNDYQAAARLVSGQSLEDDLKLIDDLFGRDNLKYGATPDEVKQEALSQLRQEWMPLIQKDRQQVLSAVFPTGLPE